MNSRRPAWPSPGGNMGSARSAPLLLPLLPASLAASVTKAARLALLAELQALLHRRRCLLPLGSLPPASSISEQSAALLQHRLCTLALLALLALRSRLRWPPRAPRARASRPPTRPASQLLAWTSWMSRRAPSTLNMGRQSALQQDAGQGEVQAGVGSSSEASQQ